MSRFHLELLKRITLKGADRFVIHKGHAFVCGLYGETRGIHILNLENPEEPDQVRSVRFRNAIGNVFVQDNTLYATENGRAIHKFDLEDITDPQLVDSFVLLGYDLYDMRIIGDYAFLAMNWDGIGVVDLNLPDEIQPVQKQKVEKGYVERLVPFGENLLFTSGSDDPFLYEISFVNGSLNIVEKREFTDFNPSKVFYCRDEVVLYGKFKKGKKEINAISVLNAAFQPLGEPIRLERPPNLCFSLSNGNILFGFDYSYVILDKTRGTIIPLFAQFEQDGSKQYVEISNDSNRIASDVSYDANIKRTCMDSLKCAYKQDNFFFAIHGDDFISFRIGEDSLFQNII